MMLILGVKHHALHRDIEFIFYFIVIFFINICHLFPQNKTRFQMVCITKKTGFFAISVYEKEFSLNLGV